MVFWKASSCPLKPPIYQPPSFKRTSNVLSSQYMHHSSPETMVLSPTWKWCSAKRHLFATIYLTLICRKIKISFFLLWELCRWHVFLGWVCYIVLTHTQPLKEMSAGLYRRWWQTPCQVSPKRSGEINEFLKEAFSTAPAQVSPTS